MAADVAFSIVIPAKNASVFVHEALESVCRQTFRDFEVIVVNDNSTDSTVDVVNGFKSIFRDGQLRILHCSRYHLPGPGAVRNLGLRAARGQVVAFLDADDVWLPDHLEYAYECLNEYPEATAYYSLARSFDAVTGEWMDEIGWGPGETSAALFDASPIIIQDDPVPHSTGCVRRHVAEMTGGFEERLLTAQDWWFWICVAQKGPFVFNPRVEMLYRVSKDSHTGGGDGLKTILSGPCFADIATSSGVLTLSQSRPLRELLTDRTSRRLQHTIRTGQWNFLMQVWNRMLTCTSGERRIWVLVWLKAGKGLLWRAIHKAGRQLDPIVRHRRLDG